MNAQTEIDEREDSNHDLARLADDGCPHVGEISHGSRSGLKITINPDWLLKMTEGDETDCSVGGLFSRLERNREVMTVKPATPPSLHNRVADLERRYADLCEVTGSIIATLDLNEHAFFHHKPEAQKTFRELLLKWKKQVVKAMHATAE